MQNLRKAEYPKRSFAILITAISLLVSCNRGSDSTDAETGISLSPRVERAADLTDSVWMLAAAVHVNVSSTDGKTLFDDTALFSAHAIAPVRAPADQGVVVTMEGLDNHLAVVWSGKQTLPPGTRDTTFRLTVDAVTSTIWNQATANGSANTPSLDSIDASALADSSYDRPLHVYLSNITPGAKIQYTLDGSYPTGSSPLYDGTGILIDSSRTLEVLAIAPGWVNSAVLRKRLVLQTQPVAVVSSSATPWTKNTYDHVVTLVLASPSPHAEIHYTLDGSIPDLASAMYRDSLVVDSNCTLKATAFAGKSAPSTPLERTFVLAIHPIAIASSYPSAWKPDTFDQPLVMKLSSQTSPLEIHYTLDGTSPTRASPIYRDSLLLDTNCLVTAMGFVGKMPTSTPGVSRRYVLQAQPVAISSLTGYGWEMDTYAGPVTFALTSPTTNAEIHYTLDGTPPTRQSPRFIKNLTIDSTHVLNAVSFSGKSLPSTPVLQQAFQFRPISSSVDTISTPAWTTDTYDRPITVTLTSMPPNADIHYTLDGTTPTKDSPRYTKAIPIDSNRTVNSIAFDPKTRLASRVSSQAFHFQMQPVVIAGDQNVGWPPFRITMACLTPNAVIHYAQRGNTPTADSTAYKVSLVFQTSDDSVTYTAIAVDPLHPNIAPSMPSSETFRWTIPWDPSVVYGVLLDSRDGKSYKTVQMGTQTWMAENLNFVPSTGLSLSRCLKGASGSTCLSGGRVYAWATAMKIGKTFNTSSFNGGDTGIQGICPTGWHVPSGREWKKLTDTLLDGSAAAAATLTRIFRIENDNYTIGNGTLFCTSTESTEYGPQYSWAENIGNTLFLGGSDKSYPIQLRCLKN